MNKLLNAKLEYLKYKGQELEVPGIDNNGFIVYPINYSLIPQTIVYLALHQCYSHTYVASDIELETALSLGETKCGEIAVKRLLEGGRGHWSPLEHISISFACGYIDHDSFMQARTHRIGVGFSGQSMRYTSNQFIRASKGEIPVTDVIFLDTPGMKTDRTGNKMNYTEKQYRETLDLIDFMLKVYASKVSDGIPPESAREILPHNYRQHFVVTFNLRSFLHFCDLRLKADAQSNIIKLANMLYTYAEIWAPELTAYYTKSRKGKARLAP